MMKILFLFFLTISGVAWSQSSMRRCTLLPVTDSVGGAIGYKVFDQVEESLKKGNWCTYVSNSPLLSVFTNYREGLPRYLKEKEVLKTVAEKLSVGSVVRVELVSEVKSLEIKIDIFGENGEDLYFSEVTNLKSDDVEDISNVVVNWLEMYSKTIPYDAKINGMLGDQITLDVGKGYPIKEGQTFVIKRPIKKKQHPLLKKIVDWDTEELGEGKIINISDNQALGLLKSQVINKKISNGDWVRLSDHIEEVKKEKTKEEDNESAGTLGILSVALMGSSSSVDTTAPSGSNRMSGNLFGVDFRAEGWITRNYFAAIEIEKSLGSMKKSTGTPEKSKINVNTGSFKLTGGYKYLPIGFFYGPQVDIYTGYATHTYDLDYSIQDGFGKNSFSGLVLGSSANIPINREYRLFARAEFLPFAGFTDTDDMFESAKSVSSMELEIGAKYSYTLRTTFDVSLETRSRKGKFDSSYKEVSYKDNILKFGISFNY